VRAFLVSALLSLPLFSIAQDVTSVDQLDDQNAISELYRLTLTEGRSYYWLKDLCFDIGARLSGSPEADSAVDWAVALMQSLDLDVSKQPVQVPVWRRGEKEIGYYTTSSGEKEKVRLCALGGSVSTGDEGIKAPVIEVGDWDELEQLGREQVQGKIVFFNEKMPAENLYTFHSYGHCVKHRWGGAVEAAKYGAVGAIVRSLSLRIDPYPHTGSMHYEAALDSIPAAAISTMDAEALSAALHRGDEVEFYFRQTCDTLPDKESYNVVGEMRGSEFPDEVILVGGHLDSWDLGHGAHDDGAGVVQSLAVLDLFQKLGYQPKRTIRVVFFMNEENGLRGAKEYARLAEASGQNHIAAIESDRGGFTPRGFHVEGSEKALHMIQSWEHILEPYGLHQIDKGGSGADIGPLKTDDNVLIGFVPDSQRYFDHHHAETDTFDHVNQRELELGAASIAALVYLIDRYGI